MMTREWQGNDKRTENKHTEFLKPKNRTIHFVEDSFWMQMNVKITPHAMLQNNEKIDRNKYVPAENEYKGSTMVLKKYKLDNPVSKNAKGILNKNVGTRNEHCKTNESSEC